VAHIDHNEVRLVQGEYAYVVRDESDPSTVKIVGRKGEELLYFRFANPTTVILRGTFPFSDGPGNYPPLIITNSAIRYGGMRVESFCAQIGPGSIAFDIKD
jgi:acyl CoA:acetate/3-ketoacid CoA transferase